MNQDLVGLVVAALSPKRAAASIEARIFAGRNFQGSIRGSRVYITIMTVCCFSDAHLKLLGLFDVDLIGLTERLHVLSWSVLNLACDSVEVAREEVICVEG